MSFKLTAAGDGRFERRAPLLVLRREVGAVFDEKAHDRYRAAAGDRGVQRGVAGVRRRR